MRKFVRALAVFSIVGAVCLNTQASNISELKEQKQEQENKKAEAEETVKQLQNQQNDILSAIAELDQQVADYNTQIQELEGQKDELEAGIDKTKKELKDAQADEQEQYEAMKKRIQYSYENGNVAYIDTIFTSADVSDIINKSEYVEQIYNYDSAMLADLINIKNRIAKTQNKLETSLEEVQEIEGELNDSKQAVEVLIQGKEQQAKNYASSIDDYQSQVAQLEADIAATDSAIAAAEEAARQAALEAARKAALAAGLSTENVEVPVYYTGGTFQWPVASGGHIGSHYGPRWGRLHQGVDIGCETGTPILAGEAGTVIAAGYSSSMGNYVVIDHGGGVSTVYMHNTSFAVSAGQTVGRGDVIAYAGSTGNSTGPHCHFGLRINGVYVDPEPYLL